MAPDLSLHDRFVLTALTRDDGSPRDTLQRWEEKIVVRYDGPPEYRQDVIDHLDHLGEITGLWVRMDYKNANFLVEISDRDTPNICQVIVRRGSADVHIWSALGESMIRQCILQEMTQALGPGGDLDGIFGSRDDTVFASWGGADHLTKEDTAVLRILYDDRLYSGMPREDVLAILPEIVAEVEAAPK